MFENYRKEMQEDTENRKKEIAKSQDAAHHISLSTYPLYEMFLYLHGSSTPKGDLLHVAKTHDGIVIRSPAGEQFKHYCSIRKTKDSYDMSVYNKEVMPKIKEVNKNLTIDQVKEKVDELIKES